MKDRMRLTQRKNESLDLFFLRSYSEIINRLDVNALRAAVNWMVQIAEENIRSRGVK